MIQLDLIRAFRFLKLCGRSEAETQHVWSQLQLIRWRAVGVGQVQSGGILGLSRVRSGRLGSDRVGSDRVVCSGRVRSGPVR